MFSLCVPDMSWPPASQHRTGAKSHGPLSHSDDIIAHMSHFTKSHWTSGGEFEYLLLKIPVLYD